VVTPKNYASFSCLIQREEGFSNHAAKVAPVGVETSVIRMENDMDILRNPLFQMDEGDGPVGIFLTAEYLCGKVGNALHSMGLSFPGPILLMSAGVQNHEPHEMAKVTSIDVPLFDMANKATDLLLRILNGETVYTPGFYEIPAVLTVRGSCGE
jgi:DNA-binding LacI/PurR family transcriptional regulator